MLQHPPELAELIDDIRGLQENSREAFAEVVQVEPPHDDLKRAHFDGQPWLRLYSFNLPERELATFFARLQALLLKYKPFEPLGGLRFEQVLPDVVPYIKGDVALAESSAVSLGISTVQYRFFLQELARPLLKEYAALFGAYQEPGKWRLAYCPVCGRLPSGGRYEKQDGRRFLLCSHCETEWLFNRVTCPHCYNDEHPSLGYFTTPETGDWRVSFCSKCGSYIKEITSDKPLGAHDFELAVQLDLLAKREGFKPLGAEA